MLLHWKEIFFHADIFRNSFAVTPLLSTAGSCLFFAYLWRECEVYVITRHKIIKILILKTTRFPEALEDAFDMSKKLICHFQFVLNIAIIKHAKQHVLFPSLKSFCQYQRLNTIKEASRLWKHWITNIYFWLQLRSRRNVATRINKKLSKIK